ncbi:MAG: four helix bundle protein [Patescibacteria group bacterium]|jgi:four helix bundle protein
MNETKPDKKYDLEDRTLKFAENSAVLVKSLPRNLINLEYSKQFIRSSASIGANYIEANEALSKKDFLMRVKISRKEAKETFFWLVLLEKNNSTEIQKMVIPLKQEVTELKKIFSAIIIK